MALQLPLKRVVCLYRAATQTFGSDGVSELEYFIVNSIPLKFTS